MRANESLYPFCSDGIGEAVSQNGGENEERRDIENERLIRRVCFGKDTVRLPPCLR